MPNNHLIQKVSVLGAGTMGSAIAQHFCMKGLEVTLVDLKEAALERGFQMIKKNLEDAQEKKIITPEAFQSCISRLKVSSKQSDMANSDLVVEAIFEDLQIKRTVFADLEKVVRADCILATNTSSFLVTDIAQGLKHPERVVGVHYFYHAAKNKLVEVIPGKQSQLDIVQRLYDFYCYYDKIPIIVKDAPGFAVNRFFVPWLNEAARLLEDGHGSIAYIDEVARELFGVGMGPFALMNATGVPIAQHAAEGLAMRLGKFYLPAQILKTQVASQKEWDVFDTTILKNGKNDRTIICDRLLGASLGIAAQMVDEGVTDAASTDLGARVGLRWPKGPFELMKDLGLESSSSTLASFLKKWDLKQPRWDFKINTVALEISGKNAYISFQTPDRMNPLNEGVFSQLDAHWSTIEKNDQVQNVFFSGMGKAFVAGADIKFFLDCMKVGDYKRIYNFTNAGQELLKRIAKSKKRSVAYLNGMTLGGGLELALACHYRVATPKAMLGLPETGIGIFPGLGGTQRTTRLIGKGLTKYLVSTGQMLNSQTALDYGLVDQEVKPVMSLNQLAEMNIQRRSDKRNTSMDEAFGKFTGDIDSAFMSNEIAAKSEKVLKRKAPLAVKAAMKMIDQGENMDLDAALKLELEAVSKIFETKDAQIGLSSIMTKSRPEFTGV